MAAEVVRLLEPAFHLGTILDATVGGGGHSAALLDRAAEMGLGIRLLGVDIDAEAVQTAAAMLAHRGCAVVTSDGSRSYAAVRDSGQFRVMVLQASYVDVTSVIMQHELLPVGGAVMDLGASLHQLTTSGRGFGFDIDGPIDMRFDQRSGLPNALTLLRHTPPEEVARWLWEYGGERRSRRIARVLHERRQEMRSTADLTRAVRQAANGPQVRKTLARVFQALRIAANHELEVLQQGLRVVLGLLAPGGRLVVISYHSGEDRIVKLAMREAVSSGGFVSLTRKPLRPTPAEVRANPRSRSARLRSVMRAA